MSADVLQKLTQRGTLTIDAMADLFNIKPHSCYPYLVDRELRYGHVRTLCRRASDPRIPAAFFTDLMAGTGWSAIYIEAELDFDGDGDVDTDDVLGSAIDALRGLGDYLAKVQDGTPPDPQVLANHKQRVMQGIVTSERAAAHIAEASTRGRGNRGRKKARPFSPQRSNLTPQRSTPGAAQ